MDLSKLKSAVLDLWRFSSPALVTTGVLTVITFWVAPDAMFRAVDFARPFVRMPGPQVRESLAFFGIDKLIPLLTAFIFLLLIYLISRMAEIGGDTIPPHISFAPSNLAPRLIGNVMERRLKVHFRCTSDSDLWDRSEEYASSLDRSKSRAALNVDGLKELESRLYTVWLRTKFVCFWVLVAAGLQWHFSSYRHMHVSRVAAAMCFTTLVSALYFFRMLSAWKNYVGATIRAAVFAVTEDPMILDAKARELPASDNPQARPAFYLNWRPGFLRSMEPALFFDLSRFPLIYRLLTGRNLPEHEKMKRKSAASR